MTALLTHPDPDGLLEYSVVYTDRALNHMSQRFQGVMRDISRLLKVVYHADATAIVPGSGTFGMEAVARQFATEQKVLVIRNGWFSFRWTQIFDMGRIPADTRVLKARQVGDGPQAPFAPAPIDEVVAAIREYRPAVVFAPHVETASGMMLPDDYLQAVGAAVREVADVSGAGDTAIATLAACVGKGLPWAESMHLANAAAGVAVGKMGTAPVSIAELNEALREQADNPKLFNVQNLVEKIEEWRRKNETVVFTNGCFDLLHLGHLHSFMKAREACDVLFVGLNTDASIKRLKGEDRPINNEEMRSLLLASLDFIDYVVPFDEDTALPLIEKLRPDVIAKEGYPLERWPEGQYVISYGGQALELPRLEGFSSTNIINRMKSSPE